MQRWGTERVYQDLRGELGLDHYEGRRFPGWHHHVSVALCCFAFIAAVRMRHFPPGPRAGTRPRAVRHGLSVTSTTASSPPVCSSHVPLPPGCLAALLATALAPASNPIDPFRSHSFARRAPDAVVLDPLDDGKPPKDKTSAKKAAPARKAPARKAPARKASGKAPDRKAAPLSKAPARKASGKAPARRNRRNQVSS